MVCVIPDMAGSSDVGLHIQHTLVRSFCWENDIRLLTVSPAATSFSTLHFFITNHMHGNLLTENSEFRL